MTYIDSIKEYLTAALHKQQYGDMTTDDVEYIQRKLELAYRAAWRAPCPDMMGEISALQSDIFNIVAAGRAAPVCALSATHANRVRERLRTAIMTLGHPAGEFMPLDWSPMPSRRTLYWSLVGLLVVFGGLAYWVS